MSGKSPYQGSGGKIPFFGTQKTSERTHNIDPIVVGSPKTSVYVKDRNSYGATSNYIVNKPKTILKTANPVYTSGYNRPIQSVYVSPSKRSVY
jgi:hypothetical protein